MSPVTIGPFCDAFPAEAPEEECDKFARVRVYGRTGLLGAYCRGCWANIRPGLAELVSSVTEVEGFAPPKRREA